jgi:sucrose-6-phosphate hydrolase SacC (GH32 family)
MFSGSAAVDWNNTSGLQKGKEKTVFTFYTAAGNPFTQCMAYSNDCGRTWTKYEGNPILPNVISGNRDPKVMWHKASKQWIMVIFKDDDTFAFFGSPDLKKWTHLSDIKLPGSHECPDIFELPIDGNPKSTKWIFMPSYGGWYWDSPKYYIGNFDGKAFTVESGPHDLDFGASAYAGQTFSDTPESDGRRIFIAWGSRDANEPMYPGNPFNGLFWFPRSLTLRNMQGGLRLHQEPVKEITKLYTKSHTLKDAVIKPEENLLSNIKHDLLDVSAKIEPDEAAEVGFTVYGEEIKYDVSSQTLSFRGKSGKLPLNNNALELRILVDRTSVEIFSLDGTFALSRYFMPDDKSAPIAVYAKGGDAKAKLLEIHELKSIWK